MRRQIGVSFFTSLMINFLISLPIGILYFFATIICYMISGNGKNNKMAFLFTLSVEIPILIITSILLPFLFYPYPIVAIIIVVLELSLYGYVWKYPFPFLIELISMPLIFWFYHQFMFGE